MTQENNIHYINNQQNDTLRDDIHDKDTLYNCHNCDTQQNDTQHNDAQYKNIKIDTQHYYIWCQVS
jgi:hypothetical protein